MTNYTMRATSEDAIQFQLKIKETNVPIDLTGLNYVELRLKNGTMAKSFKTNDVGPKLIITNAVQGKLEFKPGNTDFTTPEVWRGFFWLVDTLGRASAVVEEENFTITVIEKF